MGAPKLRAVKADDEITKLFDGIFEQSIPLVLAQKDEQNLITCQAKIIFISQNENPFVEVKSMDPLFFKLNPLKKVLIYSKHRNILFESDFNFTKEDLIKFNIPDSIKSSEQRSDPRLTFSEEEDSEIVFYFMMNGKQIRLVEFSRSLFDISNGGLSIKIEKNDLPLFKKGKTIHIIKCPAGFSNRMATVLYVKKTKESGKNIYNYRVGLKFLA